ncbi:hypothetical protein RIF29_10034 [Crotalaria pallida]|uniref:Uncharacterized protein n=1 Tax=Crotalaria pallida TaxID=3830 RepID=A0AAN9IKP5_CROPI
MPRPTSSLAAATWQGNAGARWEAAIGDGARIWIEMEQRCWWCRRFWLVVAVKGSRPRTKTGRRHHEGSVVVEKQRGCWENHRRTSASTIGSSKSQTSQLLNKVARKINAWSGYLEAANTLQSVAGNKSNNDNNATKCALESKRDNIIIRQPPVPNDVNFISTHSSTSAQLLNKMATSLSQKVHGHVAAREMFSKLLEGGESSVSGNDDHAGGCLDALNLFEDGKITRIIDSPFSPTQIFNEVTRTSCFSDNWQSVSSNYTSFGNCAASASDSSVSEVNMVNGGRFCIESPNYSSSCFLDENATTASAANESDDYLSEILTRDDEISMQLHQYL